MNASKNYILQGFIEMIHNSLLNISFPSDIPIDASESFTFKLESIDNSDNRIY